LPELGDRSAAKASFSPGLSRISTFPELFSVAQLVFERLIFFRGGGMLRVHVRFMGIG
jgi:hypothetical protein